MLPKSLAESQKVFQGVRFDVHEVKQAGRDGRWPRREAVVHPGAVVILPILDERTLLLIHNERFAVGRTLWELPAGTLEPPPETPESCAARELIEETGHHADQFDPILQFYTSPGFCTERIWAFAATSLTDVGQQLDPSEKITVEAVSYDRTMALIHNGQLVDGKSIATLLYYDRFVRTRI